MRAVVFAYHTVGVRCLSVLLDAGVDIALVLTHQDAPGENIWFDSVIALCERHGLSWITPDDPNTADVMQRIAGCQPDILFSFYYRQMLKAPILALAPQGAMNMHGSLLPRYRGRVPVNWAIIHGERETGATLHYMTEKPDAGAIIEQATVPILGDDTAIEVFHKVVCAAEIALHRAMPAILAGTVQSRPQDLAQGSYFSGRRPEHGEIDWNQSAQSIHNLIRAVAPPYPGAFTQLAGKSLRILRSKIRPDMTGVHAKPTFFCDNRACYAQCGDGVILQLLELEWDNRCLSAAEWSTVTGGQPVPLLQPLSS